MSGLSAWRFIVAGLFVGGVGAGCGTPTPERTMQGPPERIQETSGEASDASIPPGPQDAGLPPEPLDAGLPPEEPAPDAGPQADAGAPPVEAEPEACEGVPNISPQRLAEWQGFSDVGSKYISCMTSVPNGGGGAFVLRGDGVTFQIASPGGYVAWYIANGFRATVQPGGMLGISEPMSDLPHWLTFVNGTTGEVTHHPNEQAMIGMTAVAPMGGLRALLEDGTFKAYSATGVTRWSLPMSLSAPVNVMGVDVRGHTLLLAVGDTRYGPSTVEGLWVDDSGQPGQPFLALAQAPPGGYELLPQAREGLFLAISHAGHKTWAAAFAPLQPLASPAPAWLAAGAERPLHRLPGGKGYLRTSSDPASGSSCHWRAELLSPSGSVCGTLHLPPPAEEDYQCEPLKLGADGTLVEPLGAKYVSTPRDEGPDATFANSSLHCMVRWWPRLLE